MYKNSSYSFIEKKKEFNNNLFSDKSFPSIKKSDTNISNYFSMIWLIINLLIDKPIISKYLAIFWKIIYLRINKTKISIQPDYTIHLFFPFHELHKIVANNTISVKQNTSSSNQQPYVYSQNSKMLLNKLSDHDESV